MKLDGFATQDNAEHGVWFEPVLNGIKMGVEFLVIGKDSDKWKKYQTAQTRLFGKLTKDELEIYDVDAQSKKGVAIRIIDMRTTDSNPITLGGEVLPPCEESYIKIFTAIPDCQDAIWSHTEKRSNFLPQQKENSSKPLEDSSSLTSRTPSAKAKTPK